jgi:formylglycine-generating enzyme required for sulfatase activity
MRIASIAVIGMLGFLFLAQNDRVSADDFHVEQGDEIIAGRPASKDQGAAWWVAIRKWRDETKAKIKYDGAVYDQPALKWTQRNFVQPQMMVEDRYFYDPVARKYTVDKYLDDLDTRYGGIDSVLIWPVYPNVGIDNRNQHDLLKDMPGGIDGVREMIAQFHKRGVHVLFPMMPWEAGARDEGVPLKDAVARDFKQAGIDGVNGDTMSGIGKEFWDAGMAVDHPLAFEPECGLGGDLSNLQWDVMTWGYWPYPAAPVIDRYKWLEPRHMTNICDRWAKDHTNNLQSAFFNGCGFESWENIWGIWNGMTPRDAEALRRIATIERALADYLVSPDWEPYAAVYQPGIYASRFQFGSNTLWLFVNRSNKEAGGQQICADLQSPVAPYRTSSHFYDVWHGTALIPSEPMTMSDRDLTDGKGITLSDLYKAVVLSFSIEANGFGAVLETKGEASEDVKKLLATMAKLSQKPLSSFSNEWKVLPQKMVEISPTAPALSVPEGMVPIPAATYHFKVHGVEIEGDPNSPGVDIQYPWENFPGMKHEYDVAIKAFAIDKYPVTNVEFKKFLDATKYHPADDHNFLKDWKDGLWPDGWAKKPVTWVSQEDARAYAKWAGKRLPHEWEWQYAAQGNDGRLYPWGTHADPTAIPRQESGHDLRGPTDVDAFPEGASPFRVMDMTGNVWQWTDEYQDEHTRAAILRGGSYYRPGGSQWYFPQNTTLDQHGKYLLMCPGKDRAGTIGFRCVKDM